MYIKGFRHNMQHDIIRLGLVRIFYPCLMIFGTIGNILCLKILLRKRFRRQSTCQYLCILAVIDILFIYMRSTRYLYRHIFHVDLRNTSLWICRSFIFFSSTLSHLASWILVIVSFDRYFIIKNLFQYRHAGWRVIKSTCILIFIIYLANAHYFYILGKEYIEIYFQIFVCL
jgi:7 transmembrane receptor (rhodopsin family)